MSTSGCKERMHLQPEALPVRVRDGDYSMQSFVIKRGSKASQSDEHPKWTTRASWTQSQSAARNGSSCAAVGPGTTALAPTARSPMHRDFQDASKRSRRMAALRSNARSVTGMSAQRCSRSVPPVYSPTRRLGEGGQLDEGCFCAR